MVPPPWATNSEQKAEGMFKSLSNLQQHLQVVVEPAFRGKAVGVRALNRLVSHLPDKRSCIKQPPRISVEAGGRC
jgi:hypothetical protein